MANLTAARNTQRMGDDVLPKLTSYPAEASAKIFVGSIVVRNAAGNVVNGGTAQAQANGCRAVGICFPNTTVSVVDNTGGAAGAIQIPVHEGIFKFLNSASTDLIAAANVGQPCYVVDDQTVSLTDGSAARCLAGIVQQVDSDGVWVLMSNTIGGAAGGNSFFPRGVLPVSIPLVGFVVGGGTAAAITPGFSGRIIGGSISTTLVGAGAGATFVISVKIGGVATTGGTATITLANQTQGAELALSGITGANTFTASQQITIVNAAGTVFTSGQCQINLFLG